MAGVPSRLEKDGEFMNRAPTGFVVGRVLIVLAAKNATAGTITLKTGTSLFASLFRFPEKFLAGEINVARNSGNDFVGSFGSGLRVKRECRAPLGCECIL